MRKAAHCAGFALFLAFGAFLAALFYFGGYRYLLSDQSSSFLVELARTQSRVHRDATIVVLGNSTAAEDFLAQSFRTHSPGVIALNLGVPAAHFYFYERILDVSMREGIRPKKIILILTPEVFSARSDFDFLLNDLTMLKTELNAADLTRLAGHTRDLRSYTEYASRVVVRPLLYRAELQDFFLHPRERIETASVNRQWLASFDSRTPMNESNNAFSVCEVGPLRDLPAAVERVRSNGPASNLQDYARVEAGYRVRAHYPLAIDPFEAERFRRVLEKLVSAAPDVYVAAAPFYDPDFDQYPSDYRSLASTTMRTIASQIPHVMVLPDFTADCSMFADTVHLNRKGGEQFTEYLRTRVL